jgi:pimeloyl-ACP methyl ester carboxylesterase
MVDEAEARVDMPWADLAVLRSTRGLVRSQFLRNRAGWAAMRRITVPTLVIWGDEDRLVAPDLAPFVAAEIPDSRLLVLPHVGHVAMMEQPEPCARAELALLEDVATAYASDERGS